jgi:hypothetical protein
LSVPPLADGRLLCARVLILRVDALQLIDHILQPSANFRRNFLIVENYQGPFEELDTVL